MSATSNSMSLKWMPVDGNGMAVKEHIVELSENGGKSFAPAIRTAALQGDVSHLQPFTEYTFRLQGVSNRGSSAWSPEVTFKTLAGSPAAVTQVAASDVRSAQATVSWQEPSENGAKIEKYTVFVQPEDQQQQLVIHSTKPLVRLDSLKPNSVYNVRVQAANSVGLGPLSKPLRFISLQEKPVAVTGLHLVSATHNAVKVQTSKKE